MVRVFVRQKAPVHLEKAVKVLCVSSAASSIKEDPGVVGSLQSTAVVATTKQVAHTRPLPQLARSCARFRHLDAPFFFRARDAHCGCPAAHQHGDQTLNSWCRKRKSPTAEEQRWPILHDGSCILEDRHRVALGLRNLQRQTNTLDERSMPQMTLLEVLRKDQRAFVTRPHVSKVSDRR